MNPDRHCDPPIRSDGLCAVCLEPRLPRKLKPVYQAPAEQDPFCSNTCARYWYGNALPNVAQPKVRGWLDPLPPAA